MNNRIDAEIKQAELDEIMNAFKIIKDKLPFLLKMTTDEHLSIHAMDDGRMPFVQKCFDYVNNVEVMSPGNAIVKAGQKDLELFDKLSQIKKETDRLSEMVNDTRHMAGAEAYEVARFIYMKAQMALKMKEPGMQSIVDDLGKLYNANGSKITKKSVSANTPKV
jgi:hypothetical protein